MAYITKQFEGSLNSNEFISALYNAYALVYTYSDNLSGGNEGLADKFKQDGGQYRDQSVYTDVDVLFSRAWDSDDANVLQPEFRGLVKQEMIVLDRSRQIGLTLDSFLTKRAWQNEGNYDTFRSVLMSQIQKTRQAFEDTLINTYVGIAEANGQKVNSVTITMPTDTDVEKQNRLRAMETFKTIGNTFNNLADYSRNYNVNGFLKKFSKDDFILVFNDLYASEFRYVDTPTIFHKDDLLANGIILNHRYFGKAKGSETTADGVTHRATDECLIRVTAGKYDATSTGCIRVLPGDLIPEGTPIADGYAHMYNDSFETVATITAVDLTATDKTLKNVKVCTKCRCYVEDPKIICKLIHKSAIKYLSGISVGTEFVNGKNHTQNHYFTWMYAEPRMLRGYPIVTIKEA